MLRKKAFWIGLIIVLVLAGGGYYYYQSVYLPGEEPEVILTTATTSTGDLVISVSGTGVLYSTTERELGFQTESGEDVAGYLEEVLVEVGDKVEKGDVLARLEDEELEFAVLKAYIDLRTAQFDLADVTDAATEAELADARADLESAQLALTVAQLNYENAQKSSAHADARDSQIAVEYLAGEIQELTETNADEDVVSEAWSDRQKAEVDFDEALHTAEMEELEGWNQIDQAQLSVVQAQEELESLETGADERELLQAQLQVDRAELALEEARDDLEAAVLYLSLIHI